MRGESASGEAYAAGAVLDGGVQCTACDEPASEGQLAVSAGALIPSPFLMTLECEWLYNIDKLNTNDGDTCIYVPVWRALVLYLL